MKIMWVPFIESDMLIACWDFLIQISEKNITTFSPLQQVWFFLPNSSFLSSNNQISMIKLSYSSPISVWKLCIIWYILLNLISLSNHIYIKSISVWTTEDMFDNTGLVFFLKRFIFCNNIYHISIDCVDQLWVRISIRARCTTLCDNVCQWLATGWWFFPGPPVSSINKSERHYITEILLKKALNTIKQKQTNNQFDDLDQIVLRKCLNK